MINNEASATRDYPSGERQPTLAIAFAGQRRIAAGELTRVARITKELLDKGELAPLVIFNEITSEVIEIDFRGTVDEVVARLHHIGEAAPAAVEVPDRRGPGRPRLGVVAREVTLFPRHWEWLTSQPGGASVALRKLVEEARRANYWKDRARQAQESVYRFMTAMAGNFPDFEEALRAFYAGNQERFNSWIDPWPKDVRDHVKQLVRLASQQQADAVDKK